MPAGAKAMNWREDAESRVKGQAADFVILSLWDLRLNANILLPKPQRFIRTNQPTLQISNTLGEI
jgi:hypothetical protein